jgi:hypothetical protein
MWVNIEPIGWWAIGDDAGVPDHRFGAVQGGEAGVWKRFDTELAHISPQIIDSE